MTNGIEALGWDDFRLIRAVAEAGSLPAAADRLRLNHSTVFRRLRQVEATLGFPLFERDRTKLVPTTAGEELAALAERIGKEVDAASLRLAGRDPQPEGEVRIATNDSLLVHLLSPLFAGFREVCPRIRLDVVIGNPALNLSRRDADVAVRATDRPPETLVGRKVARIAWALYGRRGEANAPASWVALGEAMGPMQVVRHALAAAGLEGPGYRVNSVLGLAEAVEAGIGIGHLPCFIGDAKPALARLAEPDPAFAADLWLLTHPDLRRTPRIRILLDFLAREIGKHRDRLEGMSPAPG
ncbi:LysR family transcriptional regulator [Aureimonas leprariae]|uniref:LysR family transcriptional regulator n=1 Tax=Plantimonas leprariae TaxID=2615207 RepID=A0A7V7PLN4_9HYPH|nr:LysR family transcriptional regulator [Aureimonas leprariae]KAB0677387.1 LysR family transcriptional regulator [Aureimonas leprariae]